MIFCETLQPRTSLTFNALTTFIQLCRFDILYFADLFGLLKGNIFSVFLSLCYSRRKPTVLVFIEKKNKGKKKIKTTFLTTFFFFFSFKVELSWAFNQRLWAALLLICLFSIKIRPYASVQIGKDSFIVFAFIFLFVTYCYSLTQII